MRNDLYGIGIRVFIFLVLVVFVFVYSKSKMIKNELEINKIEYSAFIPEGQRPTGKYAAMAGAPAGTIEKGIIDKDGTWKREGINGKFEKNLTKGEIDNLFLDIQDVLDGKKEQPEYFNTAIQVKKMKIFYENKTLHLNDSSNQGQYLRVKNILEKEISSVWEIDW